MFTWHDHIGRNDFFILSRWNSFRDEKNNTYWFESLIHFTLKYFLICFSLFNRFEDGTIPYLSIISLLAGYETIEKLIPGQHMNRIAQHCFNLANYLYESLNELKYSNGRHVIHFYHDTNFTSINDQGAIVNFNVLHEDGNFVGFSEVNLNKNEKFHSMLSISAFSFISIDRICLME